MLEFLNSSKLESLNEGNEPIVCSNRIIEVIEISLRSFRLVESIKAWKVCSESFLSDNRHVLVNLEGSVPVRLIRNPSSTHWDTFREDLEDKLGKEPQMNMKGEELWRDFCNFINDLPASARLHRALSRDLKTKIGSLAAPRGKL